MSVQKTDIIMSLQTGNNISFEDPGILNQVYCGFLTATRGLPTVGLMTEIKVNSLLRWQRAVSCSFLSLSRAESLSVERMAVELRGPVSLRHSTPFDSRAECQFHRIYLPPIFPPELCFIVAETLKLEHSKSYFQARRSFFNQPCFL
jgi:hypothetical protein